MTEHFILPPPPRLEPSDEIEAIDLEIDDPKTDGDRLVELFSRRWDLTGRTRG